MRAHGITGSGRGLSTLECYDRIAAQMTELALEPIRLLRQRTLLAAVTSRALCRGRRFHITISKAWPAGPDNAPTYRWEIAEVDPEGWPIGGGVRGDATYDDPEEAYWGAVESLGPAMAGGQAARS